MLTNSYYFEDGSQVLGFLSIGIKFMDDSDWWRVFEQWCFFFFYQQWINKIKGDISGVSQPIYSTQKWTSYKIHKRYSSLWLEQNNLKVRAPYPKKNQHRRPPITQLRTPLHRSAIILIFAYLRRPPTTHMEITVS